MKAAILSVALLFCAVTAQATDDWTVNSSIGEHAGQYSPLLLANGDIGMLVDYRNCQFQDTPSLKSIHAVGVDFFPATCREGRRTADRRLVRLGRMEEEVTIAGQVAKPSYWSQRLDIFKANSEVVNEYSNGAHVDSTVFVAQTRPVIAVRKRFSGNVERYVFAWRFRRPGLKAMTPPHVNYEIRPGELAYRADRGEIKKKGKVVDRSHVGTIRMRCDSSDAKLTCDGDTLYATLENPQGEVAFFVGFSDTLDKSPMSAESFGRLQWDSLKSEHEQAWNDYWSVSFVSLPDKRIERVYQTALYTLKCWSTAWSVPVGILPTHWEGNFFGFAFNTPAFLAAGHVEEAKKIARFWSGLVGVAHHRVGRTSGKRNANAGLLYSWQSMEDGDEGTITRGHYLNHTFHNDAIAAECWNVYDYTRDLALLKEVYPVISGAADYYLAWLVQETRDGRTIIGPVCDLERLPCPAKNAFLTTCAAIHSMEKAAEAAALLGVDDAKVPEWRRVAAALRRDLPRKNGRYIPFEGCDVRSIGTLGGLYPFPVLSRDDAVQRRTVDDFDQNGIVVGNMYSVGSRICTWYAAWAADDYALLGDAEGCLRNLERASASAGFFNEIFEINEPSYRSCPWCQAPQATFVRAVHDMLVQVVDGKVVVAPAVPKSWRDYAFRLRVPGNRVVEARCVDGVLKITRE